ncbi:MAG TPA: hypothetical protein PKD45_07815 [Flavobacteriales bacterium]|nr:hypothetical protein [Flavobacteriales bacterium]
MTPDRDTYEAWLLDHIEGRLTPGQVRALEAFLEANPDLGPEPGPLPAIEASQEEAFRKEGLYKTFPPKGMPDAAGLDDFLVAHVERDLGPEQEQALKRYLQEDPEAARQARLMALARIGAETMACPGKEGLKKQGGRVVPLWGRLAAAASILLVMGLGAWYLAGTGGRGTQVADNTEHASATPKEAVPSAAGEPAHTSPNGEADAANEGGADMAVKQPSREDTRQPAHQRIGTQMEESRKPMATLPRNGEAKGAEQEHSLDGGAAAEMMQQVVEAPVEPIGNGPLTGQLDGPQTEGLAAAGLETSGTNGQTLGQALANVAREKVLNTGARRTGLDGDDLVAMADKAAGAVAPGSGVELQRGDGGDRLKLRLGRNVSINMGLGR